ncbi:zinc finger-containing ubiquitin peptidase 1 [Protopterus annectens]|uniref:zinc finger-containing ubiquitin peptidase 1 n=1 Tax=Protopterus annectens TaxID=7888 RepID=UPI001CF9F0B2|nr:zinc finger-containing ubiquitin peptidase 1 [Protopterus annectens]
MAFSHQKSLEIQLFTMFACDICGEDGLTEPEMKTHLLIAHLATEPSCPFCSLSGVTYDELTFHVNTAHAEVNGEHNEMNENSGQMNARHEKKSNLKNSISSPKSKDAETKYELPISPASKRPSAERQSLAAIENNYEKLHSRTKIHSEKCIPCLNGSNSPDMHFNASETKIQAVLYSIPECPFCGQTGASEDLEEHLKQKHANLLETPTKGNSTEKLYECPMCSLICANCQILQEHVELHLQENAFGEEHSQADQEVAKMLQEEEEQYARSEQAVQEKEEFQKLKKQYGLDNSGGYKQQCLQNMHRAVARGKMHPVEFHKRKVEMMESIAFGADDGRTKTSGILRSLYEFYQRDNRNIVYVWLSCETDHFHASVGDKGWGCGYRNFQMMLSSLSRLDAYKDCLKDHLIIPCIPKIQSMIEAAWKNGYDPQGASHFGGKLQNTKAWIGASDIYILLTFLGLKCRIVDFHQPTGPSGTHPRLFEWVKRYYASGNEGAHLPQKVFWTHKPPIYLQHQGHSRTVIGLEERMDGSLCLLIFDPGCMAHEMNKLLSRDATSFNLKIIRRFLGSLKYKQYQTVVVEGILSSEEKNVCQQASKVLVAEKIP